jgi:2-dehydro-3-deoxygalactonokinase
MTSAAFIAGDWGTTHLRAYLCDGAGNIIDKAEGPGVAEARSRCAEVLSQVTARWAADSTLPVLLCGMVGSSIGWKTVNPVRCPADPQLIATAIYRAQDGPRQVFIVPGLTCKNVVDAPDFMRGEETQILGALQSNTALQTGMHLLVLPGTHTKWVMVRDGRVEHFLTAPTGELFSLLCKYSVLVHDVQPANASQAVIDDAFDQALATVRSLPQAGLMSRLFECRSRRLAGELAASDAASFMSGLLIAYDVKDALELMPAEVTTSVQVIGSDALCHRYVHALSGYQRQAVQIAGERAVCLGLTRIFNLLRNNGALT